MSELKAAESFLMTILDANPNVILIIDEDIRIEHYNRAAKKFVGENPDMILQHRSGTVLHCINSTKSAKGCGYSPDCASCVIRNSVVSAINGQSTCRERTRMTLVQGSGEDNNFFLITAAPLEYEGKRLVHLVLEDITEFMELRELIPICAECKKIRQDDNYWDSVEKYVKKYLSVDFSHGLCPDCTDKYLKEIDSEDFGHKD